MCHIFQPSIAPKLKVIDLIFFNELASTNLGYEHAFQPYAYSQRPFLGDAPPPQSIIDSDPLVFIELKDYI